MKRFLLLTLTLIAVGCSEPIPRNLEELVWQGDDYRFRGVYLDRETVRPYSGPVFDFFPDDTTRFRTIGSLKDGKWDGLYEDYWANGQLWEKGTYKDGEKDGLWESYHENGQLEERVTHKDEVPDGPTEGYYDNGQLRTKGTYRDGELDGLVENYYENGQLQAKTSHFYPDSTEGRSDYGDRKSLRSDYGDELPWWIHGPFEIYSEDGVLFEKGTMNMGEPCGEWFENGKTVTYDPCPPGLEDGN